MPPPLSPPLPLSPPPLLPYPPQAPDATCTTRYLFPGMSSSTWDFINIPSISNVAAITMWFYPLSSASQGLPNWNYILDARHNLGSGYILYSGRMQNVGKGSGIPKVRFHDMSTDPPTATSWTSGNVNLPPERWYHLYAEASSSFTGGIKVFGRFNGREDLHARFASVAATLTISPSSTTP